jgi:hypothetical protein
MAPNALKWPSNLLCPTAKPIESLSLGSNFALDTAAQKSKFHAANRAPHRVRGPTRHFSKANFQEIHMKRLALVAAVLVAAACSTKETPKADTAAPAMAPAPAMGADSSMKMDSTAKDTSAAAKMDTAMKKVDTAAKKLDDAKGAMKDAAKKP